MFIYRFLFLLFSVFKHHNKDDELDRRPMRNRKFRKVRKQETIGITIPQTPSLRIIPLGKALAAITVMSTAKKNQ